MGTSQQPTGRYVPSRPSSVSGTCKPCRRQSGTPTWRKRETASYTSSSWTSATWTSQHSSEASLTASATVCAISMPLEPASTSTSRIRQVRPPGSSRRRKTRTTSRTSTTSNSASTTAQSTWSGSTGPGKSEKASSGPISYASSTSRPAARSATVEMSVGSRGKPNSPPPFSHASTSGGHFSNSVPTGTSVHGASSDRLCASAIWRYEV